MKISRIRALRGPNLWSRRTAIEAIVSCDEAERRLDGLPGFAARLHARFPGIGTPQAPAPRESDPLAHALAVATLSLQAQAGCPVSFARTRATDEAGVYQVAAEYSEEPVGRLALELAEALCRSALEDTPFDLAQALARLRELDEDVRMGPSTASIVHAGVARGIPYRRLTDGSLVQLGWGSRQRRMQAAEIDATSAVAEQIAQDKELTKQLLAGVGVPVPLGRAVTSLEEAIAAFEALGGAVVVKPRDGNQGKGVSVNVETRAHLEAAWASATEISSDVLIERYVAGDDFRALVVGGRLVAAARRDPPQVTGDGVRTVRELVEELNRDPRRGEGHSTSLTRIRLDEVAATRLAMQGLTADCVPPAGARVMLRNNANLSTGGSATDVTDEVHPEWAARAVEAAQTVGLDICGVDVVCRTVSRPLEEQDGAVVEVNAAPGLRMHLAPSYGKGRPVGEAIISTMFGEGDDGRIPLVAVTGTNGKTTTVRLIAHLLAATGARVGMTNTDGIYVNGQCIDTGDCSGPRSARNVLMHPHVDAAVFETARGGLLREGLGFDRCKVAVVTNIGVGDHLGLNYISTVEDLAALKRVVVENVAPDGMAVLNAADPLAAEMAASCPGSVTFFAADEQHPVLREHRARGERVVYVDDNAIVAAQGVFEQRVALSDVGFTHAGAIDFQVENAMAATAAAWALGLDWQAVRTGLHSFATDASNVPGRFNVFGYRGATVIADYGHNPDAIAALTRAIETMPAQRRFVVISGAGDRRDEDIRRQTEILGEAFDEAILYEDQCQRGRGDGEVVALLRQGLDGAQRVRAVHEVHGEFAAIDTALERLAPGDLCLILIDQIGEALAHLASRVTLARAAAAIVPA
ncbi:MAG: cyanophycin synthetase [Burkholderiales bacterium]|nr:cyanophycin synthetase [Burkholderiales bacterium]OJX00723.1 MAG: cyanophycin synthetase [Burkholderiales bacterium 70-64]